MTSGPLLIAGGGIGGLTAAIALRRAGFDAQVYERAPEIREMGAGITEDRETFRRLSPINYVDKVTTPTLVLHGEADERCPIGQGEELFAGLVAAGKVPTEFVRYPGGSHMFIAQGRPSHRVDFNRRVVDWVTRHASRD